MGPFEAINAKQELGNFQVCQPLINEKKKHSLRKMAAILDFAILVTNSKSYRVKKKTKKPQVNEIGFCQFDSALIIEL